MKGVPSFYERHIDALNYKPLVRKRLERDGLEIRHVPEPWIQDIDLLRTAITANPAAIGHIPPKYRSEALVLLAVRKDHRVLDLISDRWRGHPQVIKIIEEVSQASIPQSQPGEDDGVIVTADAQGPSGFVGAVNASLQAMLLADPAGRIDASHTHSTTSLSHSREDGSVSLRGAELAPGRFSHVAKVAESKSQPFVGLCA